MYCSRCGYKFEQWDQQICPLCNSSEKTHHIEKTNLQYTKKRSKLGIGLGVAVSAIIVILFFYSNQLGVINFGSDMLENLEERTTEVGQSIQKTLPLEIETSDPILSISKEQDLDELRLYALELINNDRKEHGLSPVLLSDNQAAQIHAQDVFDTGRISHWMTNGEKPYMTYTKYGGTGGVSQNVATSYCKGLGCDLNSLEEIKKAQYGMMYDDAESKWGHRDNILRPYHTHVSLGVVFDNDNFVYVQNFEDNYIEFNKEIIENAETVVIDGTIKEGSKLVNLVIHHDPYPNESLYNQHRDDGFYELGEMIAIVEKPLPFGYTYDEPDDLEFIVANSWSQTGQSISMDFAIWPILDESGVYTLVVWIERDEEMVPATTYSIFVK